MKKINKDNILKVTEAGLAEESPKGISIDKAIEDGVKLGGLLKLKEPINGNSVLMVCGSANYTYSLQAANGTYLIADSNRDDFNKKLIAIEDKFEAYYAPENVAVAYMIKDEVAQ